MVQLLATLTLGHESQLQALAVQDTYILFLQPGTSSIIPAIQQTTVAWKQEVDQKTATQSLRLKLVTMISQALLDRMLKVAQASTTMDIWEAIRHNPVLEPADQTGTSHAEAAHLDDQHAESAGRADRTDQGSDSGGQTQVPEGLRSGLPADQNHALDATSKPSTPPTLRGPSDAVSFVGVEPPSSAASGPIQ